MKSLTFSVCNECIRFLFGAFAQDSRKDTLMDKSEQKRKSQVKDRLSKQHR